MLNYFSLIFVFVLEVIFICCICVAEMFYTGVLTYIFLNLWSVMGCLFLEISLLRVMTPGKQMLQSRAFLFPGELIVEHLPPDCCLDQSQPLPVTGLLAPDTSTALLLNTVCFQEAGTGRCIPRLPELLFQLTATSRKHLHGTVW